MVNSNEITEYDSWTLNNDIFAKLDSYREILSNTNIAIKERHRKHGILFTTVELEFFEENHFLNILGIDYELNKDNMRRFHHDVVGNVLNLEQSLPNVGILEDFFKQKLQSVRLREILYQRNHELLCLDVKFDLMMNKYIIITVDDVTDSLSERFLLEDLVISNKILVKEVHHRVKNNIQILLSLINLQERFHKKDNVIKQQMKLSLASMALMHSQFESTEIKNVSINSILSQFQEKCNKLYSDDDINFDFYCDEDIKLVIDKANPILLVINELIAKSIDNHFEDTEDKHIYCNIEKVGDNVQLTYKDNGVKEESSTDMLLQALISQTDGQSHVRDSSNYEIVIDIPLT